jgi:hypothetical protein
MTKAPGIPMGRGGMRMMRAKKRKRPVAQQKTPREVKSSILVHFFT